MRPFRESAKEQIHDAYRTMAKAGYRPAAPSDGFGNITMPLEELDLAEELWDYSQRWWDDETSQSYWVGLPDSRTRKATIYAVEAARLMAGGIDGFRGALRMLNLAVSEMEDACESLDE